jgi:RimJ/RimL family protein N-acetyltransferase
MLDLGIEVDGRLVGEVQARHPLRALPAGVFELGIEIYETSDRRQGYGSEATAILTGWLFESAGAERVQAGTALGNSGMRRVLDRLGFGFEGVMRSFRAGPSGREDFVLYGLTKSDWEGTRRGELSGARREGPPQL